MSAFLCFIGTMMFVIGFFAAFLVGPGNPVLTRRRKIERFGCVTAILGLVLLCAGAASGQ